jgi:hypothetical protein
MRAALLLLAAFLALPPLLSELARGPARATAVPPAPPGRYRVYVADWGYHTAVIFPQPAGWRLGPPGQEGAPFVEAGWGDRRFYMESDYRPHALVTTLLLPSEAVSYLAAWDAPPEQAARPRALYVRDVSADTLRALAASVEGSIRRGAGGGRARAYGSVQGYAGRFYPAHGHYGWWDDCNRWTAERMAAAGLATGGAGVIFSGQVAGRLLGFRRVAPAAP